MANAVNVVAQFESVSIPGLIREVDSRGRWWVRQKASGTMAGPCTDRPSDAEAMEMINRALNSAGR